MRRPEILHLFFALAIAAGSIPSTAAAVQDPATEPETASEGPSVARAVVCTAVEEREPVGASDVFPAGTEQLVCFTDVRDAEGETIVHAWIHEGTTRARVELNVRGPRWRTWSTKQLLPEWTGQWEVKVLTDTGVVLETIRFTVE